MILKEITIEQLSEKDIILSKVFVFIPFLYHPFMKELKRKESYIQKLDISINRGMVGRDEVLISFMRLFGIPSDISTETDCYKLFYAGKSIEIEFSDTGLLFSGCCQLSDSDLIFSENAPYIKIIVEGERETVIVLPEGGGEYYMNLDKKESEREERQSVIGQPVKLIECYNWLQDNLLG